MFSKLGIRQNLFRATKSLFVLLLFITTLKETILAQRQISSKIRFDGVRAQILNFFTIIRFANPKIKVLFISKNKKK